MTPEDRDLIRAECAMRVLAAMATRTSVPRPVTHLPAMDPHRREVERDAAAARMHRAFFAANEADALIAELEARQEFDPLKPPETIEELVRRGVAAGGTILSCAHGVPSYEPCAKCDEADVAGKSGTDGADGEKPAGLQPPGENV